MQGKENQSVGQDMASELPVCVWHSKGVSSMFLFCFALPQVYIPEFKLAGFPSESQLGYLHTFTNNASIDQNISGIPLLELPSDRFTNELYYFVVVFPFFDDTSVSPCDSNHLHQMWF